MTKRNKFIYWVATIWLTAAMTASGIQQIVTTNGFVEIMEKLGFPNYFSVILGVWRIAGVIAILIPEFPLLKELAYAGFFFEITRAIFSHIGGRDEAVELFAYAFF